MASFLALSLYPSSTLLFFLPFLLSPCLPSLWLCVSVCLRTLYVKPLHSREAEIQNDDRLRMDNVSLRKSSWVGFLFLFLSNLPHSSPLTGWEDSLHIIPWLYPWHRGNCTQRSGRYHFLPLLTSQCIVIVSSLFSYAMTGNLSFSLDWIKVKRQASVSVHVSLSRFRTLLTVVRRGWDWIDSMTIRDGKKGEVNWIKSGVCVSKSE